MGNVFEDIDRGKIVDGEIVVPKKTQVKERVVVKEIRIKPKKKFKPKIKVRFDKAVEKLSKLRLPKKRIKIQLRKPSKAIYFTPVPYYRTGYFTTKEEAKNIKQPRWIK